MIIRGHNHFICYFFDHVCFHFPFTMVLSKCKGSRQKQITKKSSLHFEEISILLSCPSTDSKIVCAAPNLLCHTKIYLDIVLVPNFLCQTKRWFALSKCSFSASTKLFWVSLIKEGSRMEHLLSSLMIWNFNLGGTTWDQNYTPGVDFLDHDLL